MVMMMMMMMIKWRNKSFKKIIKTTIKMVRKRFNLKEKVNIFTLYVVCVRARVCVYLFVFT